MDPDPNWGKWIHNTLMSVGQNLRFFKNRNYVFSTIRDFIIIIIYYYTKIILSFWISGQISDNKCSPLIKLIKKLSASGRANISGLI